MNAGEGACTVPVISHYPPVIFNGGKGYVYLGIFIYVPRCCLINYCHKMERKKEKEKKIFVGRVCSVLCE